MKHPSARRPPYIATPRRFSPELHELKMRLRRSRLHTVCESARCPNIGECFRRPAAAFMILGNRCTRACRFCAVGKGEPSALDPAEPEAVAEAAAELGLKYVVVTSVSRDDLEDGGAAHFAAVVRALHRRLPGVKTEVLIPDFRGRRECVEAVLAAGPTVVNHNVETVPRLYPEVRPQADYERSLAVLRWTAEYSGAGERKAGVKSGLMVGLGEEKEEVLGVMRDLQEAGCEVVTVGQYLQPRRDLLPGVRFWRPEEYEEVRRAGEELGLMVFAGPRVRSSYLADLVFSGEERAAGEEGEKE